ncbi:MAG TPA: nucleoside triphosphate pyrophosphohydrolase family protein [Gemmatimonadaceae bacterium]
MTLPEYELAAARTINPALTTRDQLLDATAGLAEEAGEALGLVRKHLLQGRPLEPARLSEELGDALWCLTIAARCAGLTLEQVAQGNVSKLRARHPSGFGTAAQ